MNEFIISHKTHYRYNTPVLISHQATHLEPLSHAHQTCRKFELSIEPTPSSISRHIDFFGNPVHIFSLEETHSELIVTSFSEVQVFRPELPSPEFTPSCDYIRNYVNDMSQPESLEAIQFIYPSVYSVITEEIKEFAKPFFEGIRPFLKCVLDLFEYMHNAFVFDPKATTINTSVQEFLSLKKGVCQDFTHLAISAIRSMGLPARYVSGYILTNPPPGTERLLGADASHAYISIYIPGYSWISLDPTNNMICEDKHIMVANGRDYDDVSVLSGTVTGGLKQDLTIEVTVAPKEEWSTLIASNS